jgi:hypothetical protein
MFYKRIPFADLPKEDTSIWTCTKDGCNVWMRDNFAFEHAPTCRMCLSPMVRSMKVLPLLVNTNIDLKSRKTGIQIKPAG